MGQTESTAKNNNSYNNGISSSTSSSNIYGSFGLDKSISNESLVKSNSTNEIITINQIEKKEYIDPELEVLYKTPVFYPLLSLDDEDNSDDDENENLESLGDEEKLIRFLKKKHQMTIPNMDPKFLLNLSIDVQTYLKNSTGYIHEQQNEIMQKIRDVETKQAKKFTNIMQIKTSDATQAQLSVKEVLDKVNKNIDKSKEIIFKIADLIEKIETSLPANEVKDLKDEMNATFGPLPQI
ncbi:hypothetical protein DICPUDRAFT_147040 [Dictyostelium purpureum]|uniref:BLOC-1-related complex subunit 5 n=1 Tax=Dictyostelium purpureum TaxID=5786 RepID=F0Z7I1_DICPU|nr:uncharacterized protein DICPUDRAFT_147040 [Dictyostelium purpureum]EGC40064.1 hypothetical protein DICPUDRAFT_147040 [Dictyostelium purpureum]|eukprot:XP_003283413.1 hypothetical protein DICPUDRAFT_147040 [Dictyostelium purpureum]